ncbi:MAG: UPF0280 family protein [Desulfobacterales bacterium]|jgi:ApbE superfamily uncharacterized protein (UPF0280 family)
MHQERTYRNLIASPKLIPYKVVVKETDLLVNTATELVDETRELILEHRGYVEAFIKSHPEFAATLIPWQLDGPAPDIIVNMVKAARIAGVGPMAAIAGAIAEQVGHGLLELTDQVIIENGGDVFIKTNSSVTVGIFAGKSPLSLRIGIRVKSSLKPKAVCTSSGTIGHSLSFGKADAVCAVADSCSIADAAATAIGNLISRPADIDSALKSSRKIKELSGIVVIVGHKIGMSGDLEVVSLKDRT